MCSSTTARCFLEEFKSRHRTEVCCFKIRMGNGLSTKIFRICETRKQKSFQTRKKLEVFTLEMYKNNRANCKKESLIDQPVVLCCWFSMYVVKHYLSEISNVYTMRKYLQIRAVSDNYCTIQYSSTNYSQQTIFIPLLFVFIKPFVIIKMLFFSIITYLSH